MSIYDPVHVGNVRFEPDFAAGGETVTVAVTYYEDGHPDGEWKAAWVPDVGHAHFCIPLRVWEHFQQHGRRAAS